MITCFWLVNDYNARKCYVLVMDVMWMRLTECSCVCDELCRYNCNRAVYGPPADPHMRSESDGKI